MSAPVWILHDGKVGLRNQVMGVAEAVGLPFEEKRLDIRHPWKLLPPALWLGALNAPGPGGDRLAPPWPRLVIGGGWRAAPPGLAVRAAAKGFCVVAHIQDPKLPPRLFDLMIVAEHDKARGENVFVTRGAVHRVTRAVLDRAAAAWAPRLAHLPQPRVAVLIGGSNGDYVLDAGAMTRLAEQLAALARAGVGLMVTPSRRTGAENEAILRRHLSGPGIETGIEIWDGTGENPYFGYLGLADHVVVTADSISMITEASATGRPVHVVDLPGGSKKFGHFHRLMRDAGITRPFTGALPDWRYPVADETAEAGRRIRDLMAARGLWPS